MPNTQGGVPISASSVGPRRRGRRPVDGVDVPPVRAVGDEVERPSRRPHRHDRRLARPARRRSVDSPTATTGRRRRRAAPMQTRVESHGMFGWSHSTHASVVPSGLTRGSSTKSGPATSTTAVPSRRAGTATISLTASPTWRRGARARTTTSAPTAARSAWRSPWRVAGSGGDRRPAVPLGPSASRSSRYSRWSSQLLNTQHVPVGDPRRRRRTRGHGCGPRTRRATGRSWCRRPARRTTCTRPPSAGRQLVPEHRRRRRRPGPRPSDADGGHHRVGGDGRRPLAVRNGGARSPVRSASATRSAMRCTPSARSSSPSANDSRA